MSNPITERISELAVVRESRAKRLLEYFDRAFVINLPERTDRRRGLEAELLRAGLADPAKVEFFSACKVSELGGFPSLGARGCFLSHLSVLQRAQREGLQRVLVMEDDLAIAPQFVGAEAQLVERLQHNDWALAYFGHLDAQFEPNPPSPIGAFRGPLTAAHFYGVRGEYIGQLVQFLEGVLSRPPGDPRGGVMHVDGAFHTFRLQHPEALTLVTYPNLGTQRSSRSDVTPKWHDRLPFLRSAATAYRWAKRRVR
jgi:glycosyl transferase family 25